MSDAEHVGMHTLNETSICLILFSVLNSCFHIATPHYSLGKSNKPNMTKTSEMRTRSCKPGGGAKRMMYNMTVIMETDQPTWRAAWGERSQGPRLDSGPIVISKPGNRETVSSGNMGLPPFDPEGIKQ
jgi:hypothetical protein